METYTLTLARDGATAVVDGKEVAIPARLPPLNVRAPVRFLSWRRRALAFFERIHRLTSVARFDQVIGDDALSRLYLAHVGIRCHTDCT
jgi:hypothetical protein